MISEVCDQIRGRCGKRQVKRADVGLAHTLGGPGTVACVAVVGRP
jgi:acetyl-CoA C-acetyltransferase